ncbi:hypothetical protein ACWCWD_30250 [Streptomyces sp. NPDC001493]
MTNSLFVPCGPEIRCGRADRQNPQRRAVHFAQHYFLAELPSPE